MRLTVVKLWYQNDFGCFGRRDERFARALLADPRVGRVVHVEPPLLRATPDEPLPARAGGLRDGGLWQFTPVVDRSTPNPWREILRQVGQFCAEAGAFSGPSLLWASAPGLLADQVVAAFGERFERLVTEIEDDHREYFAEGSEERLAIQRRYERLVRASDLLLSNSPAMVRAWSRLQPATLCVRNAVDPRPYDEGRPESAALAGTPRPRITYAGNLRLRLRPELFVALARAFPQASLVLAGVGGEELRERVRALAGEVPANLRFVGVVPADAVPGLLLHSDVLVLPHAEGPLTDSMDPQKLREYLASGKPVVATPVAGARELADAVTLARTPEEFVAATRAALAERDPQAAQRRRTLAASWTWEQAAAAVLDGALAVAAPGARRAAEKKLAYFQHDRPEVRAQVPATARRILDVGCGAGALGQALQFRSGARVTGIELDATAAARARELLAEVHVGDAIACMAALPDGAFDAIVCADVLEHLAAPEAALTQVRRLLAPGGVLVASLPNVRHWSVVRQLLAGDFRYEPAGILDRTHLRFFTKASATRLFAEQGFDVVAATGTRWAEEGAPAAVVEALARAGVDVTGFAEESRDHQLLFVARPQVAAAVAPPIVVAPALRASVVIPVCNAADYTRTCLDELKVRGGPGLDVVVVDNGSSDATAQVLAANPWIRVIRNGENRGFAGAVNQGLQAARAALVCVLNNDTLLTDGWLEPLLARLEREPRIGLVGPCTSYAKGRQQVDLNEGRGSFADPEAMRRRAAEWCARERGRDEDVAFLSGFCFVARRADLLPLGGLASEYGRGTFEDDELCRRLRRAGRRLVIARDSFVWHFGNKTFQALGVDLKAQQGENWKTFVARHAGDAALLARAAIEQGRHGDALKLAVAGLRAEPTDLDALWFATLATARLGRPADALRLVERYLAACPADPVAEALRAESEALAQCPVGSRNGLPGKDRVEIGVVATTT